MEKMSIEQLEKISGGCGKNFCYIWEKPTNLKNYCENYTPAYPGKIFPQC